MALRQEAPQDTAGSLLLKDATATLLIFRQGRGSSPWVDGEMIGGPPDSERVKSEP
jgi:hypothetical protein